MAQQDKTEQRNEKGAHNKDQGKNKNRRNPRRQMWPHKWLFFSEEHRPKLLVARVVAAQAQRRAKDTSDSHIHREVLHVYRPVVRL